MSKKTIGLITDFGDRGSHYIASMKNVINSIDEDVVIIDINHSIKPYSIVEASFILYYSMLDMPNDSVIIVVVDPGVGSNRKIIAARTQSDITIICPDNGIISLISTNTMFKEIYEVNNSALYYKGKIRSKTNKISSTFHGRDIMSPVAIKILNGTSLSDIGKSISFSNIVINRDILGAEFIKNHIEFMILYTDRFGNLITNIKIQDIDKKIYLKDFHMEIGSRVYKLKIYKTFMEIPDNQFGLIVGSSNYLEVCAKNNSASKFLKVESGIKMKFEIG